MVDKKILKGIKPFNKFLFRSCFYHQLIAGCSLYEIDERLFLINYAPLYEKDQQTSIGLSIIEEKEFEEKLGIWLVKKEIEDVVNETINIISCGAPVILAVDCFYLPYRADTYNRRHLMHYLLIYGYDKKSREFVINEHDYVNSGYYKERRISFEDLEKAYISYRKEIDKGDSTGFIKIEKFAENRLKYSPALFLENYLKKADVIKNSIKNLIEYCDFILSRIKDEETLSPYINSIVEDIGIILQKKRVQKYQAAELFDNCKVNELNDIVVGHLAFLHGIFAKIQFTRQWDERMPERLRARLDDIKKYELDLHDLWIKCYEELR